MLKLKGMSGVMSVALGLIAIIHVPARAAEDPFLAVAPDDAVVYVSWAGTKQLGPAYANSRLKGLVDDAKLSDLFDDIYEALGNVAEMEGEPDAKQAIDLASRLTDSMQAHRTAMWIRRVPPQAGMPVQVVVLCQAGDQAKQLVGQFEALLEKENPANLKVQAFGGVFYLFNDVPGQRPVAARPGDALGEQAAFQAAMARAQPDSALMAYVDAAALVEWVQTTTAQQDPASAAQTAMTLEVLGLDGVKSIAMTAGFVDRNWQMHATVATDGLPTGLMKMLAGQPIKARDLSHIPASATTMWAASLDTAKLLDIVRESASKIGPPMRRQVDEAITMGSQMTGVDIEKDLLRAMGPIWTAHLDPLAAGGSLQAMCLTNQLRDADRLATALGRLEQIANAMLAQQTADSPMKIQMHTIKHSDGVTIHRMGVPFVSPTWAVVDDRLYVGLYPQVVTHAIETVRRLERRHGKALLDTPGALPVKQMMARREVTSVSFVDLPRTIEASYSSGLFMMGTGVGMMEMFTGKPVETQLPTVAKLRKHLVPAWSMSWVDMDGLHLQSVEPFPLSSVFGPQLDSSLQMAAMSIGTMLPALGAARSTARQMTASTQARGIHQAQVTYAQSNKQKFTNDISDLVEGDYFTPDYVISPMGNTDVPADYFQWPEDQRRQWIRRNADYILIPDLTDDLDTTKIGLFLDPAASNGRGDCGRVQRQPRGVGDRSDCTSPKNQAADRQDNGRADPRPAQPVIRRGPETS